MVLFFPFFLFLSFFVGFWVLLFFFITFFLFFFVSVLVLEMSVPSGSDAKQALLPYVQTALEHPRQSPYQLWFYSSTHLLIAWHLC